MSSLILVPSRGRPESAHRLKDEFLATAFENDDLLFVVAEDDPTIEEYPSGYIQPVKPQGCMSWDVNEGYQFNKDYADTFEYVAFMGDDHSLANTRDWSKIVDDAGFGIIYGPDGSDNLRNELPTFWFVSTPIVQKLGWISPPYMKHFYLDDAWRELGKASGTLKYVDELYIEHLHFSFGKSEQDDTYNHTMRVGGNDHRLYLDYLSSADFRSDAYKIKEVKP
jgi:hypothetical protein